VTTGMRFLSERITHCPGFNSSRGLPLNLSRYSAPGGSTHLPCTLVHTHNSTCVPLHISKRFPQRVTLQPCGNPRDNTLTVSTRAKVPSLASFTSTGRFTGSLTQCVHGGTRFANVHSRGEAKWLPRDTKAKTRTQHKWCEHLCSPTRRKSLEHVHFI
jgi:hypothetical protein